MSTTAMPDTKNWCQSCKNGNADRCEYGGKSCEEWYKEQDDKAAEAAAAKPVGNGSTAAPPVTTSKTTTPGTPTTPTTPPASGAKAGGYSGGSDYGGGYSGYSYGSRSPGFPISLKFKCVACGHWFDSDTKLASHAQWACAAAEDDLSFAIECICCKTLDETTAVRNVSAPRPHKILIGRVRAAAKALLSPA